MRIDIATVAGEPPCWRLDKALDRHLRLGSPRSRLQHKTYHESIYQWLLADCTVALAAYLF